MPVQAHRSGFKLSNLILLRCDEPKRIIDIPATRLSFEFGNDAIIILDYGHFLACWIRPLTW